MESDAGDIFSLAWSPTHQTIYFGCQNTSLQWYSFPPATTVSSSPPFSSGVSSSSIDSSSLPGSGRSTPTSSKKVAHKFFDSYPRFQRRPADTHASNNVVPGFSHLHLHDVDTTGHIRLDRPESPKEFLNVDPANIIPSAHYGYVYCMALLPAGKEGSDDPLHNSTSVQVRLVTGAGDETVKVGLDLLQWLWLIYPLRKLYSCGPVRRRGDSSFFIRLNANTAPCCPSVRAGI